MWKLGPIQLLTIIGSFYYLGVIFGMLFMIVLSQVAHYVLSRMGYEIFRFNDITHVIQEDSKTFSNIVVYMEIDKLDADTLKKHVYSKDVINVRRVNQGITNKFGFCLWKDLPKEQCASQVKKCTKNIDNEQGIVEFCNELITTKMDYDKPLWEMHVLENYSSEKSIIFVRVHHAFSDGIGFVSFISCLLDKPYSLSMKKKFVQNSFISEAFYTLFGPIYAIHCTNKLKALSSDSQGGKVTETTEEQRQPDKIFLSKEFSFKSVVKCYKRFDKTTFNDYMLAAVSTGFDKWLKQNSIKDAKKIVVSMPVNVRPLPTKIEELKLGNYFMATRCELPLHSTIEKSIYSCKEAFWSIYSEAMIRSMDKLGNLLRFIPQQIAFQAADDVFKGIGLALSNIPFGQEDWVICNKKVHKRGFWTHNQLSLKLFMFVITYGDKMTVTLSANKTLKLDAKQFIDAVESSIENDISENCKQE